MPTYPRTLYHKLGQPGRSRCMKRLRPTEAAVNYSAYAERVRWARHQNITNSTALCCPTMADKVLTPCKTIRRFLLLAASLVHLSVLIHGQEQRPTGKVEGVIGIVLFRLRCMLRRWTPNIGVQALALLAGITRSPSASDPARSPGIAFHVAIIIL
jgi:hypothetical protein